MGPRYIFLQLHQISASSPPLVSHITKTCITYTYMHHMSYYAYARNFTL
uniref:Uncharacterized protein n=1 Tax=Arundo donax TaxID=35708 RepID=A0A0A8YCL9_ARUDO